MGMRGFRDSTEGCSGMNVISYGTLDKGIYELQNLASSREQRMGGDEPDGLL